MAETSETTSLNNPRSNKNFH